jgi:ABC-type glycerol-3-phosphate transport system substrate-binding protein
MKLMEMLRRRLEPRMQNRCGAGRMRGTSAWMLAVLTAVCVGGCSSDEPVSEDELPLAGMQLRVAVAGDPDLAKVIENLRGSWSAETGAEFSVVATAELDPAAAGQADVIVFPTTELGTLVDAGPLAELPHGFKSDKRIQWVDFFPLEAQFTSSWAGETYAVPFGSVVLTCAYRADWLAEHGRRPPETWSDYQELVESFSRLEGTSPVAGAVEPLGPGWAATTFLARAAAGAQHPSYYGALFDLDTMQPAIDGPPFVRALEELVDAARFTPAGLQANDVGEVLDRLYAGQAALGLAWHSAGRSHVVRQTSADQPPPEIAYVPLPGSREVYNPDTQHWDERPLRRVTLLGIPGRLGSMTARPDRAEASFALLAWLADWQRATPLGAASRACTLYRQSQVVAPADWLPSATPLAQAESYADAVAASLSADESLMLLRIPGHQKYMALLDEAVRSAVAGEAAPADALAEAAAVWRQLTDELGADLQRAAYRRSLGLLER